MTDGCKQQEIGESSYHTRTALIREGGRRGGSRSVLMNSRLSQSINLLFDGSISKGRIGKYHCGGFIKRESSKLRRHSLGDLVDRGEVIGFLDYLVRENE